MEGIQRLARVLVDNDGLTSLNLLKIQSSLTRNGKDVMEDKTIQCRFRWG